MVPLFSALVLIEKTTVDLHPNLQIRTLISMRHHFICNLGDGHPPVGYTYARTLAGL